MNHLGHSRSASKYDYLLQTPDTFVRSVLPGAMRTAAIVHCSPALGARFAQYTMEMEAGGTLGPPQGQRFVYGLAGEAGLELGGTLHRLLPGSFAYLPQEEPHRLVAQSEARLAVIEKPYTAIAGSTGPAALVGDEAFIAPQALVGDEALQVRSLLPTDMAFDFAVNVMTYQPGASLSMVEIHVMEHGCLLLEGGGIYRLSDCWHPVQAGDFIWMRGFCPQWFGALGKQPAKYLIYKDWNRPALA